MPPKMANVAPCVIVLCLISIILMLTCETVGDNDLDDVVFQAGSQQNVQFGPAKHMKYLLYSVNPQEGFNLRRDVYLRVANLAKLLNDKEPWTLVLPPWGKLYHWKSKVDQLKIRWSHFFDIASLARHVPVMEFEDFLKVHEKPAIDVIYYLQPFKGGWVDGKWTERFEYADCIDKTGFNQDNIGRWHWWFWGYEQVYGKKFHCLSVQLEYSTMVPFLLNDTTSETVFLGRMEQVTHGHFSEWSKEWWTARRSLRFSKKLVAVADDFRRQHLSSTDEDDLTVQEADWRSMRRERGSAIGGPYMAVHLRRLDYKYAHKTNVPSIPHAAKQIKAALKKHKLDVVYVSTDAPSEEFEELKWELKGVTVWRLDRTQKMLDQYKDGGIAIIEQWICAHARYFMGTNYSTFSFRIHEERELLGFSTEATYNCFCGDKKDTCDQPSKWITKYD